MRILAYTVSICLLSCTCMLLQAPIPTSASPSEYQLFRSLTAYAAISAKRPDSAMAAARQIDRAAAVYQKYFREPPPYGKVWSVEAPQDPKPPRDPDERRFAWHLQHLSDGFFRSVFKAQMETRLQALIKQKYKNDLPKPVIDQVRVKLNEEYVEPMVKSCQATGVLSHEVGHLYLTHWCDRMRPDRQQAKQKVNAAHYGSLLPDWIDEAFAIRCETEYSRSKRIGDYHGRPKKRIPLSRLLTMTNPEEKSDPEPTAVVQSDGTYPTVTIRTTAGDSDADYYGACAAFMEFLEQRGGPSLFRRWAIAAARGKTTEEFLASQTILPRTLSALQAAFDRWLGTWSRNQRLHR